MLVIGLIIFGWCACGMIGVIIAGQFPGNPEIMNIEDRILIGIMSGLIFVCGPIGILIGFITRN